MYPIVNVVNIAKTVGKNLLYYLYLVFAPEDILPTLNTMCPKSLMPVDFQKIKSKLISGQYSDPWRIVNYVRLMLEANKQKYPQVST